MQDAKSGELENTIASVRKELAELMTATATVYATAVAALENFKKMSAYKNLHAGKTDIIPALSHPDQDSKKK